MKKQAHEWWKQGTLLAREAADEEDGFEKFVAQIMIRDPHVSVPAMWALQQGGPSAIPALLAGLQHWHPRVRRGCIDIIDHGGYGADTRCIEALVAMLLDPVPHVRRAVWHTLFCERCPDPTRCTVTTPVDLDKVALLIDIGLHDPNPKLPRELEGELRQHATDPRAKLALDQLAQPSAGA